MVETEGKPGWYGRRHGDNGSEQVESPVEDENKCLIQNDFIEEQITNST